MSSSRRLGPSGKNHFSRVLPSRTPGPLGLNDHGDVRRPALLGDTPGPSGNNDHAAPPRIVTRSLVASASMHSAAPASPNGEKADESISGSVAAGLGTTSVVRIPVPGTNLFVELTSRGWVPPGGSTSTVFIQDTTGKRQLRLDYGFNKKTGTIDYHWNVKGLAEKFGITDHTVVGPAERALYRSAKLFKYSGRAILVYAVASDVYSIVVAKKRFRQVAKVAAGWAGAYAGAEAFGAIGAAVGSVEPGLGTAIGAGVLGTAGGIAGYFGASWAAGTTYDWIEETYFENVPGTTSTP